MLDFQTTVKTRQSIREFLPEQLAQAEIEAVLQDAQLAPSASNIQPWQVHVVSGEKLAEIKAMQVEKLAKGEFTPDFPYDHNQFTGEFEQRWREQYQFIFEGFGVTREDKDGRANISVLNAKFYNAPHVAFIFMPDVPSHQVSMAADLGMYSQKLMLSLTARGFGSIPQIIPTMFASEIKKLLGVPEEYKLLHVASFGRPNWDAQPNKKHLGRVAISESVKFHE